MQEYIADIDCIPPRKPLDLHVNQHGKSLVDFLVNTKFCILNGRFSAQNDNYTCTSSRGTSAVDYIVTLHDSFNLFKDFEVKTCESIISEHNLFYHFVEKNEI